MMSEFTASCFPLWDEWFPEEPIGQGSAGTVSRIRRSTPEGVEYAALKQITISADTGNFRYARAQGMDAGCIRYFFRAVLDETMQEIDMMKQLSGCSNIVHLEDSLIREISGQGRDTASDSVSGWMIFIRMELLTPFIDRMAEDLFSPAEICRVGMDLCSALDACRQARIVHRDVKPENIFWQKETGAFKLGDFGFAHYMERPTEEKGRAGTLTHMSPEIYAGSSADYAGDLYALGIILYRLLNDNRIPFLPQYPGLFTPQDRNLALLRRLRGENPPLPAAAVYAADLSCAATGLGMSFSDRQRPAVAELAQIARKAVLADPAARFRSAKEMRAALKAVAESHLL